jgi:uncharacterized membrane protein YgcG
MSHLENVPDSADGPARNSNYVVIIVVIVVAFVVLGLALLWGGGYMSGNRGFNMMGFNPAQMMNPTSQAPAPATQGAPGAAGAAGAAGSSGAGGSGGSGGAAGAPGAPGAQGATTPSATP